MWHLYKGRRNCSPLLHAAINFFNLFSLMEQLDSLFPTYWSDRQIPQHSALDCDCKLILLYTVKCAESSVYPSISRINRYLLHQASIWAYAAPSAGRSKLAIATLGLAAIANSKFTDADFFHNTKENSSSKFDIKATKINNFCISKLQSLLNRMYWTF